MLNITFTKMSRFLGDKEVTAVYRGEKEISAIYKGYKIIFQVGNFYTKDNNLFITKDNETFEVKEI